MTTSIPVAPAPTSPRRATLSTLLRLIWSAAVRNRGLVATIIVLGLLQALFVKAPFVLLQPLLEALSPAADTADRPWFNERFAEFAYWLRDALGATEFAADHRMALCLACTVVASVFGLLGAAAIYGTLLLTRFFAAKVVVELRNDVAAHILKLPLRFFGRRRMGELLSNITTDTTVLSRSFQLACDHVVVDPLLVLANMVLIVLFVPYAVWLLVLMVPIMALPLIRMGRRVHRSSHKSLQAMGDATESMNQMLSGIKTVKAFQLEEQRLLEFEDSNARYLRRTKGMLRAKALSQGFVFAGYQLGLAVILLGLGWLVVHGGYKFAQLSVGFAALATTYTHVKRLARSYNTLMESCGAMDRIQGLLDEPLDVGISSTGLKLDDVRGEVEFDSVSFAYGDEPVLHDFSFRARPGETVALVGPSGAGKSTALDLLARFHDPCSGVIRIDGHDLRDLDLASFRQHIAIVSQQPFLFNASIHDNIACGRPGAGPEDVVEAARAAQIHDFIAGLPAGYSTVAGERGSNLSGGQMQRITIARAILRDPAILILDEATSALDSESEDAVQKALENLTKDRTSFLIAHRLATGSSADQILVIDHGRIIERGTHGELVGSDGLYSRLCQLQQLV